MKKHQKKMKNLCHIGYYCCCFCSAFDKYKYFTTKDTLQVTYKSCFIFEEDNVSMLSITNE